MTPAQQADREDGAAPRAADGRAMLTLYSPVAATARPAPVTVPLDATVREALRRMDGARARLAVVVDPGGRIPLGVFTLEDLVRRVVLPGVGLDEPVAAVMTSGVITVGPQATGHEAILAMARNGVRRLVLVDRTGALAGIVSQEDLLGLERARVGEVSEVIRAARGLDDLRAAAAGIRTLAERMLAQGVHPESLTQSITAMNDLLTVRVIEVTADAFDLPPVPFCWIALGSEGRLEQTISTDQDNGLVFEADDADAPRVREGFLPFARAVNEALAACGFPLCKGNVMASNPQWCLTLGEWKQAFARWIETPDPEALLNGSIFFDLRPISGKSALAERLWEWLLAAVARRPLFLALLARNALRHRPPLGRIRDFVFDRSKEFPRTLDLKAFGSQIFVDSARVLALGSGISHTNTTERLRAAAAQGVLDPEGVGALVDGFNVVHRLRLRNQLGHVAPGGENRVDPRRLNEIDRTVLKEAFRQARRLQARVALHHRLEGM